MVLVGIAGYNVLVTPLVLFGIIQSPGAWLRDVRCANSEEYQKMWPSKAENFNYNGFNPKPKLFSAFQFPNV